MAPASEQRARYHNTPTTSLQLSHLYVQSFSNWPRSASVPIKLLRHAARPCASARGIERQALCASSKRPNATQWLYTEDQIRAKRRVAPSLAPAAWSSAAEPLATSTAAARCCSSPSSCDTTNRYCDRAMAAVAGTGSGGNPAPAWSKRHRITDSPTAFGAPLNSAPAD